MMTGENKELRDQLRRLTEYYADNMYIYYAEVERLRKENEKLKNDLDYMRDIFKLK